MTFQIKHKESYQHATKRIANELLNKAIESRDNKTDIHEAVHTIRKSCKKLRALLRLMRDLLGEKRYKNLNAHVRDAARKISDLRDTQANQETFETFYNDHKNELPLDYRRAAMHYLESKKSELVDEMVRQENIIDEVIEGLKHVQSVITKLKIPTELNAMAKGHNRVYKRSIKAYKKAIKNNDTEYFHEMRKRTKYLRYQTKLLQSAWPEVLKTRKKQINKLTNLLGTDHDLMVLKEELAQVPKKKREYKKVKKLMTEESTKLRHQSDHLAKLLLVESPKQYNKRMKSYLSVG